MQDDQIAKLDKQKIKPKKKKRLSVPVTSECQVQYIMCQSNQRISIEMGFTHFKIINFTLRHLPVLHMNEILAVIFYKYNYKKLRNF